MFHVGKRECVCDGGYRRRDDTDLRRVGYVRIYIRYIVYVSGAGFHPDGAWRALHRPDAEIGLIVILFSAVFPAVKLAGLAMLVTRNRQADDTQAMFHHGIVTAQAPGRTGSLGDAGCLYACAGGGYGEAGRSCRVQGASGTLVSGIDAAVASTVSGWLFRAELRQAGAS